MNSCPPQKIRLADYVMQKLADEGVKHLFLVTGGGAMHLNDAIGREKRLHYVCNHHEQASAIAAEGYSRVTGTLGVINVTTGPGGINALNGVFGAFTDSVPMLIISGQTKRETCMATYPNLRLRQLGDQEVDIISMVKPITKYCKLVMDPLMIRYELEKAMCLAQKGRPGPCWIDIPVDVQGAMIEVEKLVGYDKNDNPSGCDGAELVAKCSGLVERLKNAKRPVLLIGTGVRIAQALQVVDEVSVKLGIPIATAWTPDLLSTDNPYYCGRQGTIGTRAGNFTVQNSDLVVILGSRMAIRQISYNWQAFARCAYKFQIDIDPSELDKPTFRADETLCCDAKVFLEHLSSELTRVKFDGAKHREWLTWCKERVQKYPTVLPKHRTTENGINSYFFVETLFKKLVASDVVVSGDATACIVPFQAAEIKKGQRLFSNSGSASMGYDLPAAIGASYANEGQRVICLAGDGSIMMNIQELATVAKNSLNVKIFVLNNGGYLSIRSTQANFFNLLVGEGPESGVGFPDFVKLAQAHGIPALRVEGEKFAELIDQALEAPGPFLCEVVLDRTQGFEPKLSSKKLPDGRMVTAPLEDMAPFLDRDELLSNLLIPALE
ncbi:MAG: acetolactate synthase [Verrucomicrobiales bacterium]|nr:acetolactate synthase [Verrucomicrobiales bacterium]